MIVLFTKRRNYIFLVAVLIFIILIGFKFFLPFTYRAVQPINSPKKIYIYASGKRIEINRTSPIFKKIVKATNLRLSSDISTAQDIVDDKLVNVLKEDTLGIEFLYDREQKLSIEGNGFIPFRFHRLYFPLKSEQFEIKQGSRVYTMQYGNKDHYIDSSRGPLTKPNEVISLVEEYFSENSF